MSSLQAANAVIKQAIEGASGPLPPSFLVKFLLDYWRQYLALVHSRHGEDSAEWIQAIADSELLLWSVAPKLTDEERLDLGKSLEGLVYSIKRGMTVVGSDSAAQREFLRQLSEWHLELIARNRAGSGPGAAQDPDFDPNQTVQLRAEDLRHRELLDMLDNAYVQHIEVEAR
jgi:hypothetical protein